MKDAKSQKRKSNKPKAVQAAVIAKRVLGDSQRRIAKDLGISRSTVGVILSEAELDQFVQHGKSGLAELIPDAVTTYGSGVKSNVDRAESFLERMRVLPAKESSGSLTLNNFIGIGNLPRPDARKPLLSEPKAT
jgi:hypothetical protein